MNLISIGGKNIRILLKELAYILKSPFPCMFMVYMYHTENDISVYICYVVDESGILWIFLEYCQDLIK